MAMTATELRNVGKLYYDRLPERQQRKVRRFLEEMDVDGDGVLTLREVLGCRKIRRLGRDVVEHVFGSLDDDGKGYLDVDEEGAALYYLYVCTSRQCAQCGRAILQGLGYTCSLCTSTEAAFELCLDCFSAGDFCHEHDAPHIFLHDFVFFNVLRQRRPPPPLPAPPPPPVLQEPSVKQCSVCGDCHERSAGGFMCERHMMSKGRGSEEFVCEWCFCYFCSVCGGTFRDDTARAEPGKWMQRFVCAPCHRRRRGAQQEHEANLRKLKRRLRDNELRDNCRTCDIKYRNGSLFWVVSAGSNTAPPPPTSAPPPLQAQPPPPPAPRPASAYPAPYSSSPLPAHYSRPASSILGSIAGGLRVANQAVDLVNGLSQLDLGIGDGIGDMLGSLASDD